MTLGNLCTFATEHLRGDRGAGQAALRRNLQPAAHTRA
jgi:hypothetical protein